MKKYYILPLAGLLLIFGQAASSNAPVSPPVIPEISISYPIAELGDCPDAQTCFTYCEDPKNMMKCLKYAESSGLLSPEEITALEDTMKMMLSGQTPGGCKTPEDCASYCANLDHLEECTAFAQETGLISDEELAQAQKTIGAIKTSGASLSCKTKTECDAFCGEVQNVESCVDFSQAAGSLPPEKADQTAKIFSQLAQAAPGGCKTVSECASYCDDAAHAEECADFGSKAGLLTPEETQSIQKTISAMKTSAAPGGCVNVSACSVFCSDPQNAEACLSFGQKTGTLSSEELKTGQDIISQLKEKIGGSTPKITIPKKSR